MISENIHVKAIQMHKFGEKYLEESLKLYTKEIKKEKVAAKKQQLIEQKIKISS